jgi:hypothetical protein
LGIVDNVDQCRRIDVVILQLYNYRKWRSCRHSCRRRIALHRVGCVGPAKSEGLDLATNTGSLSLKGFQASAGIQEEERIDVFGLLRIGRAWVDGASSCANADVITVTSTNNNFADLLFTRDSQTLARCISSSLLTRIV